MASPRILDRTSQIHLDAAVGWLGLGNPGEAGDEVARIASDFAEHPDVLEVRWEVSGRQERWEEALLIADSLVLGHPERSSGWLHRSYCLHELARTLEAWNKLFPAVDRFPKEATIPYNLACYACQLGNLKQAEEWLEKAAALRGRSAIKKLAAEDRDLDPMRSFFSAW